MLDSLLVGLAVFLALELHYRVVKVRDVNGGKVVIKDLVRPMTALMEDTKPEMMAPMDEDEYNAHIEANSERGHLLKKLNGLWNSKDKDSQSSDS